MQIAICDDDATQRKYFERLINQWKKQHTGYMIEIKEFSNAEGFLFSYEDNNDYQLLVLDIEMGQMNGMELAGKLREKNDTIPIVFVTGYEEYMAQGYDVEALHYLLKPIKEDKFYQVLDRALLQHNQHRKHLFETEDSTITLELSNVWYIEAQGHYTCLHTLKESYILHRSISIMEKEMQEHAGEGIIFKKCHRSYLVNLQHVGAIRTNELVLDDGRILPLSRNSYKDMNQAFISYYEQRPGQGCNL